MIRFASPLTGTSIVHGVALQTGPASLSLRYTVAPGGSVSTTTLRVGPASATPRSAPTPTTKYATLRPIGAMIPRAPGESQ